MLCKSFGCFHFWLAVTILLLVCLHRLELPNVFLNGITISIHKVLVPITSEDLTFEIDMVHLHTGANHYIISKLNGHSKLCNFSRNRDNFSNLRPSFSRNNLPYLRLSTLYL